MPPKTKGNAKTSQGAASSAQASKKSQQTPRVHVLTEVKGVSLTDDKVFPTQGNMAQQMRTMIELLVDLSHRVNASETQQRTWVYILNTYKYMYQTF